MHSQVRGVTPLFIVSELQRSIEFYAKLGFGKPSVHGEPPCFAMINRDGFEIMLSVAEEGQGIHPNGSQKTWDMYVRIEDVATEISVLENAGVRIAKGPTDMIYQMREIEVADPDGYLICLAQNIQPLDG